MKIHKLLHNIAFWLLVVGGLNWLLVGLLDMNLLSTFLWKWLARTVYVLVGLSAFYEIGYKVYQMAR